LFYVILFISGNHAAQNTPGLFDRLGIEKIEILHDPNHAVKNMYLHITSAKKGKSTLCEKLDNDSKVSNKKVKHIQSLTTLAIKQNKGEPEKAHSNIQSIPKHMNQKHSKCPPEWPCKCDPNYKPSFEKISDDAVLVLEPYMEEYMNKELVEQLSSGFSSNPNESIHALDAQKNPKAMCHKRTIMLRVYMTALQRRYGPKYLKMISDKIHTSQSDSKSKLILEIDKKFQLKRKQRSGTVHARNRKHQKPNCRSTSGYVSRGKALLRPKHNT
jgi:hypothetical protein